MKKKLCTLIAMAAAASLTLSACGGSSASKSGSGASSVSGASSASASGAGSGFINVQLPATDDNPNTLDVQKTSDYYMIPLNIYDRLVECQTVNGEATIVPGLASSWKISDNGSVYTFNLKKGVKFSNGEELTADDVVYTVNRMMLPETKAENTDVFDMIKGAMDVYNGKTKTVTGVKALDKYTVQMTLEKPFAPFIANLSVPGASIYNKDACEKAGGKFGTDPSLTVGTGPFIVKKWVINSEIDLARNPNYFKGAAKLPGITFKIIGDNNTARLMFQNGQLDVLDTDGDASQIKYFADKSKYKNNIIRGKQAGVVYYTFNESDKPLDNLDVRKAIGMAIDRKAILDSLYGGEGQVINTIVPTGIAGYNANAPELKYDVAGAKALLQKAGYPNGFDLEIDEVNDDTMAAQRNEIVQSMLGQIGIKVKIKQYDDSTFYADRSAGKLVMSTNTWSADYNDPDNFIYTFFSKKGSKTRSMNYTNTSVMNQLETARVMVDQAKRMQLYQSLEKTIVDDDAMFLPLFQLNKVFVVDDKVQSFHVSWNGWSDMPYYGVSLK